MPHKPPSFLKDFVSQCTKQKGVFITGTDTGVGKTLVATMLAQTFQDQKKVVGVFKPYACGDLKDTRALKKAAKVPEALSKITPVFYKKPLAPIVRFGTKKKPWDQNPAQLNKVLKTFSYWKKNYPFVIAEGAGGILCPLEGQWNIIDLVRQLKLPTWVVARPQLGTLNHTLMTLECLKRRQIYVQKIILSGYKGRSEVEKTNLSILKDLTGISVSSIPFLSF